MFWFEYNFLYMLAAGGRAKKRLGRPHQRRLCASARASLTGYTTLDRMLVDIAPNS
jgi:hypothetical protein